MFRLILTTAAVMAVLAGPASASTYEEKFRTSYQPAPSETSGGQDLRSPDAVDAAAHRGIYATETKREPYALNRDYGSPDAADAARDLPPVQVPVVAATREPPDPPAAARAVAPSPEVECSPCAHCRPPCAASAGSTTGSASGSRC